MKQIDQQWNRELVVEGRECGPCYACCVYLGIDDLKKYPAQACKHLNGIDPAKRCSIYAKRPGTCSHYRCMWRQGIGPDDMRPDRSGMLITGYYVDGRTLLTIVITDTKLARGADVDKVVGEFLMAGCDEIRVVDYATMKGALYRDGDIYRVKYLKPTEYEELRFAREDRPRAHYLVKKQSDDPTG